MAWSEGLRKYRLAAGICWALAVGMAWAQQSEVTNANVGTSDVVTRVTDATATAETFAPESPGDSDLGEQVVLSRNERYRSLTLFGDVYEYYTSNAFLSRDVPQGDFFTMMQVGASWMPHLGGDLFGEVTVRQQLYRYGRFSELNFNSLDVGGGLVYVFRQLADMSAFVRYNFNLITNSSSSADLYHDQTIRFGLQQPFRVSRAHFLYAGVSTDLVLEGNPGYALREKLGGYVGYQVSLTRSLKASAFYQILYMPYLEHGRADWNQVVSGSLTWEPITGFALNAVVSGIFNESNESFYQYNALNVGAGVTGQLKF